MARYLVFGRKLFVSPLTPLMELCQRNYLNSSSATSLVWRYLWCANATDDDLKVLHKLDSIGKREAIPQSNTATRMLSSLPSLNLGRNTMIHDNGLQRLEQNPRYLNLRRNRTITNEAVRLVITLNWTSTWTLQSLMMVLWTWSTSHSFKASLADWTLMEHLMRRHKLLGRTENAQLRYLLFREWWWNIWSSLVDTIWVFMITRYHLHCCQKPYELDCLWSLLQFVLGRRSPDSFASWRTWILDPIEGSIIDNALNSLVILQILDPYMEECERHARLRRFTDHKFCASTIV